MKRKHIKHEVYKRYYLFQWQVCTFCNSEFRRETSYQLMLWNNSVHACSSCVSSAKDFSDKWEKRITLRSSAPKAPPMKTLGEIEDEAANSTTTKAHIVNRHMG